MKTGYKVMDAMTKKPIAVALDTSIVECARVMDNNHVGGLLVLKGKSLKGIITEQDVVRKVVALELNPVNTSVEHIMEKNVISIKPSEDVYDALVKMRDANIRHLPVVDGNELIGLLTIKDVLKIQPQLFDLVVEKFNLREEEEKPSSGIGSDGVCEICGEYYRKLNNKDGLMLCDKCQDEQEEEDMPDEQE